MASFKYLIFIALVVYTVAADNEAVREKKHALIAGVPAPLLTYPAAYPYAYAALPVSYAAEDDGSYWPGKYENTLPEVPKALYPSYPEDDGSYWPGKYDKNELPATYPIVYHY